MRSTKLSILTLDVLLPAVVGLVVGGLGYRSWMEYRIRHVKKLTELIAPKLKPLFNELDQAAWCWLEQVFPEHKILLKIPVLRFLSGGSVDLQSLVQLKGLYCTFTVCSPHGRVVGCMDIVDAKTIQGSRRDLKKKLFQSFGLAYTVLEVDSLPSMQALRAAFLNESMPLIPLMDDSETLESSLVFESSTVHAEKDSVANVRHSLHSKLNSNRKLRPSGQAA